MNGLKDDQSIQYPVRYNTKDKVFGDYVLYTQLAGDSMLPDYPADVYVFCDETTVEALEPGRSYLFCFKTHPHCRYGFKRFDGIVEGVIQVSAINPAYNPCEGIPLVDLIDVHAPVWMCVKKD